MDDPQPRTCTASSNLIGLKSPVVDKLVEMIIAAKTEEEMIDNCQALDYVLLNGNYVIPNWYISSWRYARLVEQVRKTGETGTLCAGICGCAVGEAVT